MKKIFLPLLLAATVCSSAQKVSNKLSFQNGQKLEVTTNMNLTSESMLGEVSGNVTSIDEYAVANSSATETTLQKAAKKMKMNLSAMGKDLSIDSDNKQDMDGQMGEPIKKLMQEKYVFTVDATGKITGVKSDEKKKKDEEGGNMMSMMMPGMNSGAAVPKVGAASAFKILPDGRDVSKGDSWTDSTNTDGNHSVTIYTVKDITDADVLLDFTQEGTTKTTQSAMGMSVDVTGTTKSSGTVTINRATGIMKQRTATVSTDSSMNMGGQEMASKTKMTIVTTVKTL